jgi:hypothetical protein
LRIVPEEFSRTAVSFITQALSGVEEIDPPSEFGSFAERILPVLQRLRSARQMAEALISEAKQKGGTAGRFALDALRSIAKSLRATGVYELNQLEILESDPAIMGEVCLVLNEVTWRLRNLARNIYLRTEQGGDANDLECVAKMIAVLSGTRAPV